MKKWLLNWLLSAYGISVFQRGETVYVRCNRRLSVDARALKISGGGYLVIDGALIDVNNEAHRGAYRFGRDQDEHAALIRKAEAAKVDARRAGLPEQPREQKTVLRESDLPHHTCSCAGS